MFWRQLLHAIADQASQKAQLSTDRQTYEDERAVQIDAELRDEKFEPLFNPGTGNATPQPQVELTVTPESGPAIVQSMHPVAGHYAASVDASATGLYRVEVVARAAATKGARAKSEPPIVTATTAFRRDDNIVEHFDMRQHRAVLQRLATDTAGRYWQLDQLDALSAAIPYTKSGIVERQMLPLWNLPFVFLVLMALKLGEWWLRLRWGTL
jgi:anti-sigma-K factor RskA